MLFKEGTLVQHFLSVIDSLAACGLVHSVVTVVRHGIHADRVRSRSGCSTQRRLAVAGVSISSVPALFKLGSRERHDNHQSRSSEDLLGEGTRGVVNCLAVRV